MFVKFFLVIALLQAVCAQQRFEVLVEFGTNFSTLAIDTQNEINELYHFNADMVREFNRELLLELGRMVPEMREADSSFQQQIAAADGVDDECREYVEELPEFDTLVEELDGEWEYYQTLAVSFGDFLFDEILAHADVADPWQDRRAKFYHIISETILD
uniref:Uncharacterized protein n=1 Tax=Anopheles merus TaxID=30066 RepID=A0A182VNE9_ANOME